MLESTVTLVNGFVWGKSMLILLLGTGLNIMTRLKAIPLRKLGYAYSQLFKGRNSGQEYDISPFNASMTAFAAIIGMVILPPQFQR